MFGIRIWSSMDSLGDRPINQEISEALGWISVACWVIVAFPQFYENYVNKTGLSLSMSFLLIWLVGDFFNLAGCFMTGQLATQVYVGVWFTIMDLVLIMQILYYDYYLFGGESTVEEIEPLDPRRHRAPSVTQPREMKRRLSRRTSSGRYSLSSSIGSDLGTSFKEHGNPRSFIRHRVSFSESDEEANVSYGGARSVPSGSFLGKPKAPATPNNTPANGILNGDYSQYPINPPTGPVGTSSPGKGKRLNSAFLVLGSTAVFALFGLTQMQAQSAPLSTGRVLLSIEESPSDVCTMGPFWCWLGAIMGWISSALYVFSRIPQILKNIERQSCEGLSMFMFVMGVMGNLTYSGSIFVWSLDPQFLWEKLPWIIGSIGTLAFDFTIFVQFFIYKGNTPK